MMTYRIALPEGDLGVGEVVPLPDGWMPLTAVRQGEVAVVLCYQPLDDTPPSGGDAPVLGSLNPDSLPAGSVPATIDVLGTGFDKSCVIQADGDPRATFYISAVHLEYTSRPDLATPDELHQITVQGDNGTSNALPFTFT